MSRPSPPARRSWILAVVLLAATGGAASVGHTQQVTGAIGASLTILAPSTAPQLRVSGFDRGADGIARIETTLEGPPRAALVTTRISSSTTGLVPDSPPPTFLAPSSGATRTCYLVNVGRARRADRAQPTELRIEYLIVAAGT